MFSLVNRYALCVVNFQAALAETSPHRLVVSSTKVPAASISASKDLELVVRAAEGVDIIDLAAAAIAKVEVASRAGSDANAVAELAMGLILGTLLRKIFCPTNLRGPRACLAMAGQRALRAVSWASSALAESVDRSYCINVCVCVCVCP
jgi:hypothetical protein